MTWLEDPPPWLRPAHCFASVIAWTKKNKNVSISDRLLFVLFWQWNNNQRRWRPVFWGRPLKKRKKVNFFKGKKYIRWPGLSIFWPRNDVAPLLRWRLHRMTCLTTLVTWKWPGCLDVLAPPLMLQFLALVHITEKCTRFRTENNLHTVLKSRLLPEKKSERKFW